MTDLGTLGGLYSEANSINQSGQVVGWAMTATGSGHGFLWEHGLITDLNNLVPRNSSKTLEDAAAINRGGQIAGTAVIKSEVHAILLVPNPRLSSGHTGLLMDIHWFW